MGKRLGAGVAPPEQKAIIPASRRETVMLESQEYQCPYCGEPVEALLDLSAGDQEYIEDCAVCCRPIVFDLRSDGIDWSLDVRREDE